MHEGRIVTESGISRLGGIHIASDSEAVKGVGN